jgi:hypothetical protein
MINEYGIQWIDAKKELNKEWGKKSKELAFKAKVKWFSDTILIITHNIIFYTFLMKVKVNLCATNTKETKK